MKTGYNANFINGMVFVYPLVHTAEARPDEGPHRLHAGKMGGILKLIQFELTFLTFFWEH
jgi:hypothetical protein